MEALEQEVVIAREQQAAELARLREVLAAARADESALRDRLDALRCQPVYEEPFTLEEPLVSVVVSGPGPAVAAALAQEHAKLEVVVVASADAQLDAYDPPVTTVVLPGLPEAEDPRRRWLEGGARARNVGVRRARGSWIATLRPGDVPDPAFVTRLLGAARAARAEVAHGQLDALLASGGVVRLGAGPPVRGDFAWGAALLHRGLASWDMDPLDALLDIDAEWGLCRRMLAAGVRFAALDAVVGRAAPDRLVAPALM